MSKRTPCTCPAYAWPHRQGSGVCRWPEAPASICATPAGTHRPSKLRYRRAHQRELKIAGLHPIRDRELIEQHVDTLRRIGGKRVGKVIPGREPAWIEGQRSTPGGGLAFFLKHRKTGREVPMYATAKELNTGPAGGADQCQR